MMNNTTEQNNPAATAAWRSVAQNLAKQSTNAEQENVVAAVFNRMENKRQEQVDALAKAVAHALQKDGTEPMQEPFREKILQDPQVFNDPALLAGLHKMLQQLNAKNTLRYTVPTWLSKLAPETISDLLSVLSDELNENAA